MSGSSKKFTPSKTIIFMVVLSLVCAVILASLASALQQPREDARELDRSKEMLVAARIYNKAANYFQIEENGTYVPAHYVGKGVLAPGASNTTPSSSEILDVFYSRFRPLLVDDKGNTHTFEEERISLNEYVNEFKKTGYGNLPLKLVYEILPNTKNKNDANKPEGFVIPVSGFGLWDFIFGYIAIKPDGNSIIGISWYEQKETPGLGANIVEPDWQAQFPGKQIFQKDSTGAFDTSKSSIGITVVRGKVQEVLGSSPKSQSAVDGMAGATLTGNGVTKAYKETLTPYRPFLKRLNETYKKGK